ncbi:MAG: hypothetical protein RB292_04640 [Patescibacteria group bacterium]|jgi:hypothetical protein|nr:hypothetical protein [Patescibacteria group bacterium]
MKKSFIITLAAAFVMLSITPVLATDNFSSITPGMLVKNKKYAEVFYIDTNNQLRWIINEQVAAQYFGSDWSQQIVEFDDLSAGGFQFGQQLSANDSIDYQSPGNNGSSANQNHSSITPGMLVKNKKYAEVFYVDANRQLRWIINEQVANHHFGANWNQQIVEFDDLSTGGFQFGQQLTNNDTIDQQSSENNNSSTGSSNPGSGNGNTNSGNDTVAAECANDDPTHQRFCLEQKIADDGSNMDLCELAMDNTQKQACYWTVIFFKMRCSLLDVDCDINLCAKTSGEQCYFYLSQSKAQCDQYTSEYRGHCYARVVAQYHNVEICEDLTDESAKDLCYQEGGIALNDDSICEKITNPINKSKCLERSTDFFTTKTENTFN